MTTKNRFEYSVVEVTMEIHSHCVGTDVILLDRLLTLKEWLSWRVTDGWDPFSKLGSAFDENVRKLALEALSMLEHDFSAKEAFSKG